MGYLEAAIGRTLTQEQVAASIGMSTSTFKRRKSEGFQLAEVLTALDHFGLSRTAGLLALGVIELSDAMDALGEDGALVDDTSTLKLAEILVDRLREAEGLSPATDEFPDPVTDRSKPKDVASAAAPTRRARLRKGLLE